MYSVYKTLVPVTRTRYFTLYVESRGARKWPQCHATEPMIIICGGSGLGAYILSIACGGYQELTDTHLGFVYNCCFSITAITVLLLL